MTNAAIWGLDSTGYNVLLVVHIVMVVAAFGSVFAQSEVLKKVKQGSTDAAEVGVRLTTRYTLPALIVAIAAGIALIFASKNAWSFDQTWISASFSIVLVLILVAWFLLLPTQKALVGESVTDARKKLVAKFGMSTGIFHLGFLLIVILMIWKPGA